MSITACGGTPPQIVDYSPERGAKDVSTALPIRLTFDHDVDMQSVESRLHLVPTTAGRPVWINPRQLDYEHPTLAPNTTYQVVLEAGYKDPEGNTALLRHHWSFVTEGPPTLAGSAPGNGEAGVDPAAYLLLNFSRDMAGASLSSSITIAPSAPFSVRLDPADGRRAIIAPAALLQSGTTYTIAITNGASDADGNQLASSASITFTTGAVRQLRHWIAFTTAAADGASGALWIVNESGFPRRLFNGEPVSSFSWSPEGDRLLVQGVDGSWSALTPGADPTPLGFKAPWAAALASGLGYAYIDDAGALHRRSPGGADSVIADAVSVAAVAPGGGRVAFVEVRSQSQVIWGYDVGLQARYQLAVENAHVSAISWSPAGNRIAYLRLGCRNHKREGSQSDGCGSNHYSRKWRRNRCAGVATRLGPSRLRGGCPHVDWRAPKSVRGQRHRPTCHAHPPSLDCLQTRVSVSRIQPRHPTAISSHFSTTTRFG